MAMSKQQLWSIVVLVVMVGSLFAAITYDSKNQGGQSPGPSVPPAQQNTTQISYAAKQVPAKVIQIFPTAILVGTTGAQNVSEVEAKLLKVPGITGVAGSEFFDPKDHSANFRTSVRFSSPEKMKGALDAIDGGKILSNYSLFPTALVSIPKTIEFKNEDAGLTQSYSPASQQAQVVVTIDTRKGDALQVTLNAEFQGQRLVGMSGTIEQNLDSSPQFSTVDGTFKIAALEGTFSAEARSSLAKSEKLAAVISDFKANPDYNSGLELVRKSQETKIFFSSADPSLAPDLNLFFAGYKGLSSFEMHLGQNYVSVTVPADRNDYSGFVRMLGIAIGERGFKIKSIEDPAVSLEGSVGLLGGAREKLLSDFKSAGAANDLNFMVLQKIRVDTNSIFVPDQNVNYGLSGGSFNALVSPTHSAGDEVNLTVVVVGNTRVGVMQILDAHERGPDSAPAINLFG